MIRKILKLKNVGLFLDACQNGVVEFGQTTLIYSENARGKSTLAAVLRACHKLDTNYLLARKTIDVTDIPELDLLMEQGARIIFDGNGWNGDPLDVLIFDSEFVERNIYSGFAVRTDQKQSLLDFVLGDSTVQLKKQLKQISDKISIESQKLRELRNFLEGHAHPFSLNEFIALVPIPDADKQIELLQNRIAAAQNAQHLIARKEPVLLNPLKFDLSYIFNVLNRQIADIEKSAEALVSAHFAKHKKEGLEDWIAQGQSYLNTDECPFCGQKITGVELIQAYQTYFNEEYQKLKNDTADLNELIASSLSERVADSIIATIKNNATSIEAWQDQLQVKAPNFKEEIFRDALKNAQTKLLSLVGQKLNAPLEQVGAQKDFEIIQGYIDVANQILEDYNTEIIEINSKISSFKNKLATEDVGSLDNEIQKLQSNIRRQKPEIVQVCNDYQTAIATKQQLEQQKSQLRQQIDDQMKNTLNQYQASINTILGEFGARFSIDRLSPDYRGRAGQPRTEYVLRIRNQTVTLNSQPSFSSEPSFSTTLSESDKRTLALAFFLARLEADPALSSKIVVLDDPVSSMDRNRRYQTIRRIISLATKCKQLITLSHDPYFIRELRDRLQNLGPNSIVPTVLSIIRVQNDYSAFGDCDLDEVCASDYYRHHRMVAEYVDGNSSANIRDVAKAIRPLLEGYLHRRFPGHIPRNQMLGKIIADFIAPATSGPLLHLQQNLTELQEINAYASQFHHDTNPDADTIRVVDAELLQFARRTLNFIYRNS